MKVAEACCKHGISEPTFSSSPGCGFMAKSDLGAAGGGQLGAVGPRCKPPPLPPRRRGDDRRRILPNRVPVIGRDDDERDCAPRQTLLRVDVSIGRDHDREPVPLGGIEELAVGDPYPAHLICRCDVVGR